MRKPLPPRFTIAIPDDAITDLHDRLMHTRWPANTSAISGNDWARGTDLAYIRELAHYWRTGFDWRAQERRINGFAHYRAEIDGLGIHFIHERGHEPDSLPIILTHGWPNTFADLLPLVGPLTDPAAHGGDSADAFDVVIPSLPGFGFSDVPQRPLTPTAIAHMWAALMTDVLGYTRFAAQATDIGGRIATRLARLYPKRIIGIHLDSLGGGYTGPGAPGYSSAERAYIEDETRWYEDDGGYSHVQETRPQTLAFALNDSPVGLAAWLVEKLRAWSDCDGDIERRFTKDMLLTTISIYWFTQTIGPSAHHYYDAYHDPWPLGPGEHIETPCAVAQFPKDIAHPPREWAERAGNLQRWTVMPRGGHFPAMEEPDLLIDDLRAFFRPLR